MIITTYKEGVKVSERTEDGASLASILTNLTANQGAHAWDALHRAALSGTVTADWLLTVFNPMIPRYGCKCADSWAKIQVAIPFRPADQFAWTVDVHNAVNVNLNKATLTLDQAKAIWADSKNG